MKKTFRLSSTQIGEPEDWLVTSEGCRAGGERMLLGLGVVLLDKVQ